MRAGKYVGTEVGGAYSVEECWELVKNIRRDKNAMHDAGELLLWKRELMILNILGIQKQEYTGLSILLDTNIQKIRIDVFINPA